MDVVLDASAAVRALLADDDRSLALQVRLTSDVCLAPHLIGAEVGNVLRRLVTSGGVEASTAEAALGMLPTLIDEHYPHEPLAAAAWRLRHNLSYYDALYVALSARLEVPLLTADARLARAPGVRCAVEVIG